MSWPAIFRKTMEARAAAGSGGTAGQAPAASSARGGGDFRRPEPGDGGITTQWSAAMGWVYTIPADAPRAERLERRLEGAPGWVRLPVVREYLRARGYGG
jgi:hypothetical protein